MPDLGHNYLKGQVYVGETYMIIGVDGVDYKVRAIRHFDAYGNMDTETT